MVALFSEGTLDFEDLTESVLDVVCVGLRDKRVCVCDVRGMSMRIVVVMMIIPWATPNVTICH